MIQHGIMPLYTPLGGSWLNMAESIQRISAYLPLTYVVRLLKAAWFGEPLREHWLEVAILGGILLACGALAARLFRWE